jgi:hypothetical protein
VFHDLTKGQKRALREAATLARSRDTEMAAEDADVYYVRARAADLPFVVGGAVAHGLIRLDDVGEAARDLVADLAQRLRVVEEVIDAHAGTPKPHVDEEDGFDPQSAVSVARILEAIDLLDDESHLYVHRITGEVRVVEDEFSAELDDAEGEDLDEPDDPQWIVDARAATREVAAGADWVMLFRRRDFDDLHAMRRFARDATPAASRELLDALSGRGAFRRFRDIVTRRRLQQDWDEALTRQRAGDVRFRLRQLGITFRM